MTQVEKAVAKVKSMTSRWTAGGPTFEPGEAWSVAPSVSRKMIELHSKWLRKKGPPVHYRYVDGESERIASILEEGFGIAFDVRFVEVCSEEEADLELEEPLEGILTTRLSDDEVSITVLRGRDVEAIVTELAEDLNE